LDKKQKRAALLKKRGALNRSFIKHKSLIISRKVFDLLKKSSCIASFSAYNNEPDPNLFFDFSSLCFPKIISKGYMEFYKGVLKRSSKGILEPSAFKRRVLRKEIDAVVVPAVGFDYRGYRLGYGGGYYDRFLKDLRVFKVGVAFDCCIEKSFLKKPHDVPVDVIISEKRTIYCKLRRRENGNS